MNFIVSELFVYPVKSCGGISVREASIESRGFFLDRQWMIVDAFGRFLSQRELPKLALIRVELTDRECLVRAAGVELLRLPLHPPIRKRMSVQIWEDRLEALAVGNEADEWFSSFLGMKCHLVSMPEETLRRVDPTYALDDDPVSFVDAFPFLLISEASLADLNSRLATPVPMNRFRPNIVVRNCGAFDEDTWKIIQIGTIRFSLVKPCFRCTTTTVDQQKGIRGTEPLRTLATYRYQNGYVMFGQNMIHEGRGTISVGDPVTVLTYR